MSVHAMNELIGGAIGIMSVAVGVIGGTALYYAWSDWRLRRQWRKVAPQHRAEMLRLGHELADSLHAPIYDERERDA